MTRRRLALLLAALFVALALPSSVLVYQAYTNPELLQRWLLGPPGWSMPVCVMDLRVGGSYRWRWRSDEDLVRRRSLHGAGERRDRVRVDEAICPQLFTSLHSSLRTAPPGKVDPLRSGAPGEMHGGQAQGARADDEHAIAGRHL